MSDHPPETGHPTNPRADGGRDFRRLVAERVDRRSALRGLSAATLLATLGGCRSASVAVGPGIPHRLTDDHVVADGHDARVLIRWGDALLPGSRSQTDFTRLGAAAQATQFGYNNDYLAYLPIPYGSPSSRHGLLGINHEYTDAEMMWTGMESAAASKDRVTADQVAVEMAAHGFSVVEVKRPNDEWRVVPNSLYARRLTASSPTDVRGPARGNDRMKTSADPAGTTILGMLGNCGGGVTPWGTVLSGEENFQDYFWGSIEGHPDRQDMARYGVGTPYYGFGRHVDRFHVEKEPNEPNRFGWVVEIDPYDPQQRPKKRTALGRFRHEGASCFVNRDGRLVVYSGDDQRFEYLYRYVSHGTVSDDRDANDALLDEGVLSVACFHDDGYLDWRPLVYGEGPLTPANGFSDQGDVVIRCRQAADLLGATPLDRPEDIEVHAETGRAYVVLTNNNERTPAQVDGVNPRSNNLHGHILELTPPGDEPDVDHGASRFRWDIFMLGGEGDAARLSCPDNLALDPIGRLWIATDQSGEQARNVIADGMWVTDVVGPGRARPRFIFGCPRGAEMCGPYFTPDGSTLFVAVQHPGNTALASGKPATFEEPRNRWPDFDENVPPRPSIVAITRRDGGVVGT